MEVMQHSWFKLHVMLQIEGNKINLIQQFLNHSSITELIEIFLHFLNHSSITEFID